MEGSKPVAMKAKQAGMLVTDCGRGFQAKHLELLEP